MDDDERQYGDSDARADDYDRRERRLRAMWRETDSDPYPDWNDDDAAANGREAGDV